MDFSQHRAAWAQQAQKFIPVSRYLIMHPFYLVSTILATLI